LIALGLAGAQTTVEGGSVTATAVGAVASGNNPPITVTVGLNPSVPVTIISGQPSQRTFDSGAPKVGVVNSCTVHVAVGSNAYIDVWADNHWVWNFGSSWASIGAASPNLSIHGEVIAGPCAGLTDELRYE
jgi:hypothetical protein